ncbi:hypothetical protein HHL22_03225 [Hymenobacter sp. RP-2-7]|uniref:Uncharacterized protein n=1 Tax=Hymenobacter polaris TaxID=2682546 RepID=A0A7Y0AB97_9BACT|nr:hypothetical protein [Hymenobacter polaris]NML64209.1 hypothetical protein [Hymenobacter polaris]
MRNVLVELAWLAGCYALAIPATRVLLGSWLMPWGILDIQMHNTYFVMPGWTGLLPLFLAAATPLTLVRAAQARFAQRSTNLALGALALLWLLLGALVGFRAWLGLSGH